MVSWKVVPGRRCLFGMATPVCVGGDYDVGYCERCASVELPDVGSQTFPVTGETVLLGYWLLPVAEGNEVRASLQGFLQKGRDEIQGRLCGQ